MSILLKMDKNKEILALQDEMIKNLQETIFYLREKIKLLELLKRKK